MKRNGQVTPLVLLFIVLSVACSLSSPKAQPAAPTQALAEVAFTPTLVPASPTAVFTQTPAQTATVPIPTLSPTPAVTSTPEPDTGRIFFTQCLTAYSGCNIYVVNADGSELHQITRQAVSANPAVSPDGKKIAFISNRELSFGVLYTMDVDGSNVKRLTADRDGNSYPSWSPDSSQIVYARSADREGEIYIIDSDGKNALQITKNEVIDYSPDWSPDGTQIVFDSKMDGSSRGIFVMDTDGNNVKRLTPIDTIDYLFPRWSPDGSQILFTRRMDGHSDIYVMNADGNDMHVLFPNPDVSSSLADWSPDGRKIVFVREVELDGQNVSRLFIGNIDGTNLHMLEIPKDKAPREDYPFWAP